jgi:uncharacterized protein (TIGR02118 family)
MHRIVALYETPKDPEHFRAYYTNTHLPLASKLPGLRKMYHSFNVEPLGPGKGFFCIWTGEFDDAASAASAMQSDEGQAVGTDVPNYASGGVMLIQYTSDK